MDPIIILELILFTLLLMLSGFFSGSETALFSLNRTQLERMTLENHPRVGLIKRLLNEPRRLIVTILIGNELVNVSASVISASLVIHFLGGEEKWWVNIFIMLPILLLVGEITPKTVAMKRNMAFAGFAGPLLESFARLITPVRLVIRAIADRLTTLFIGDARDSGNIITEDMVRTLALQAADEGVLDSSERRFIDNILNLGNHVVHELMTPRSNVVRLPVDMGGAALSAHLQATPLTRIPIYEGRSDNIIGVLHVRDLLALEVNPEALDETRLRDLLREPVVISETMSALALFYLFRKKRLSFAMVVDEYGGVVGLITMDDLLKAIFGALEPERPAADPLLSETGEPPLNIDGALSVRFFNDRTGLQLPGEIAETMGGLLLHLNGELPVEGTTVVCQEWQFTVKRMRRNRIEHIVCQPLTAETEQPHADPPTPEIVAVTADPPGGSGLLAEPA